MVVRELKIIHTSNLFTRERLYDALALMLFIVWPLANFIGSNSQSGELININRFIVVGLVLYSACIVVAFIFSLFLKSSKSKTRVFWIVGFSMLINLAYTAIALDMVGPILNLFVPDPEAEFLQIANFGYKQIGVGIIAAIGMIIIYRFAHRTGFRFSAISILALTSLFSLYPTAKVSIEVPGIPGSAMAVDPRESSDAVKKIVTAEVNPRIRPNVYLFVLDGFPRQDILQKLFGVDSTEYMRFMESRGFYIADQSHSNYPVTIHAHMAAFTMDFHIREGAETGLESPGAANILRGDAPISDAFRNRGYKIVWTNSGFQPLLHCGGTEDLCIEHPHGLFGLSLPELTLLKSTALYRMTMGYFRRLYYKRYRKDYYRHLRTEVPLLMPFFEDTSLAYKTFKLSDVPTYLDQLPEEPFFWYAHNISLHNPATDRDCNFRLLAYTQPVWPFTDFRMQGFADSTHCYYQQMKAATDAILDRDPTAIIIYIADHGSNGEYGTKTYLRRRSFDTWDSQDVAELFGILNLIRFPEQCRDLLYPSITTINTMRVIFSCIDGREYPLAEDASYSAAYAKWHVEFPRVKKFVHGRNRNYPDAVEGTSPGYTEDTTLAAAAKSYHSQVQEIRQLFNQGSAMDFSDHPNLNGWKIRPNVVFPTEKGSKKVTVAFRTGVEPAECRELSHYIYRRPESERWERWTKDPLRMWTDQTNHHDEIALSSFPSLTNRDIGCLQAVEGDWLLYAVLSGLAQNADAMNVD